MPRTALFAGSFDPPHYGHLDIIKRASLICDQLVVCVAANPNKTSELLSREKRLELLQTLTKDLQNVLVASYEGLLAEYALEHNIDFFIKSLRNIQDFEDESVYYSANLALSYKDTALLLCKPEYRHISSKLVREILTLKGDLASFVPAEVIKHL